jgi:ribosomal protein S18 acetylase RimI-like enzyme
MPQHTVAPIKIRPYRPEDCPHIRAILTRIGWEERYIAHFEALAGPFAAREDTALLMACHAGAPVGFILVEHYRWNRLAQIQGLAVDPALQRRGAATALTAQAEAWARSQGARGLYVDTPTGNTGGRRFYEAAGFQIGYVMPRYYDDQTDGVTYQRFFTEAAPSMPDKRPRA